MYIATIHKMGTKGVCFNMCPSQEIELREREKLLHPLEYLAGTEKNSKPKADPYRVVKSFCRSAAGINLACPNQLRPTNVLLLTVKYLLSHVVNDARFSRTCIYDFIVDRLRAIQQDMVIQSLPPEDCIKILEPIVRFHAFYGYRLCEENISNYDPVTNQKQLLEYLKRLLVCYDEIENSNSTFIDPNLVHNMSALSMKPQNYNSDFYVTEVIRKRPLMEAVYIMSNLGDVHPIQRYLKIPEKFRCQLLKTCFTISVSHLTRNWVKECQLMQTLPPVVLCVGVLHIPTIRRFALEVMSHAYNSKVLKYPIESIKEVLLYESCSQVIDDCKHYNIKIVDGKYVCFMKDSFNISTKMVFPKRIQFLDDLICQLKLENHLLGDIK